MKSNKLFTSFTNFYFLLTIFVGVCVCECVMRVYISMCASFYFCLSKFVHNFFFQSVLSIWIWNLYFRIFTDFRFCCDFLFVSSFLFQFNSNHLYSVKLPYKVLRFLFMHFSIRFWSQLVKVLFLLFLFFWFFSFVIIENVIWNIF